MFLRLTHEDGKRTMSHPLPLTENGFLCADSCSMQDISGGRGIPDIFAQSNTRQYYTSCKTKQAAKLQQRVT